MTENTDSDDTKYDAVFDLKHNKDDLYEVAAKIKDVFDVVDNLVILEKTSFEILTTKMND